MGAGGLGQIGYQYGYVGYNVTVMNTVIVLLVYSCFIIQFIMIVLVTDNITQN